MEEFKYLGITLTNQNSIAEEIKSRLKSRNACYHSVQNLLSSRLLSKNLKMKIYRTVILPAVLYGCETWSLTLREKRKLRAFENMVLRSIFGSRRGEERGVYRILVRKPEGGRPLGRPGRRWADNIRTDLQEMGCVYMDWIGLAQDRSGRL